MKYAVMALLLASPLLFANSSTNDLDTQQSSSTFVSSSTTGSSMHDLIYTNHSASCIEVQETAFDPGDPIFMFPYFHPLVINNGECYIRGLTTSDQSIDDMYNEVHPIARTQVSIIETNFKEIGTQIVNNVSAQTGARVKGIDAKFIGEATIRIQGRVDSQGNVPITASGFEVLTQGKLKKYQLRLPVRFTVNIKYSNILLKGQYNIYSRNLSIDPAKSSFQPKVDVDVNLPFLFELFEQLTPKIFDKLYEEFGRIVIDVFEFLGVDMTQDIPAAIQHHANLSTVNFVPITALDNKRVGDAVQYTMKFSKAGVQFKDANSQITFLNMWLYAPFY
ncbi:hypothetical protein J8L98_12315 [Pseudoalteromonas sp. MMG013]|uniref:hypothetical protein n=1 Tax=Pseudoalteromonas sp. MMG013 TaxID=2822687 RepID=UPI001B381812|nr:hypothetical protein [Pseudoalteromonas sp. MMG013]MBQ4862473.1 hypothetical protein [Pseudoalteromonas sp. MMG013]